MVFGKIILMKKILLVFGLVLFINSSYVAAEEKKINIDCTCQKVEFEEDNVAVNQSCEGTHNSLQLKRLSGNFTVFDPPVDGKNHSYITLAEPIETLLLYTESVENFYKWREVYRWQLEVDAEEPLYGYHEFKVKINRININTTFEYRIAVKPGEQWPEDLSFNDSAKLEVLYQCELVDNLL